MPESHTAANIQTCLTTTIKKRAHDLNTVLVYMVTENGQNIQAAVRQMEWTSLQCMGHTFQLAIKDAKEETPAVSALQEGTSNSGVLQAQCPGNTMAQELPEAYGAAKHKSCSRCGHVVAQ